MSLIGVVDGEVYYCAEHANQAPNFDTAIHLYSHDGETDSWSSCAVCGGIIYEHLTPEGVEYHLEMLREYVASGYGNAEFLDQVAEGLEWYLGDSPAQVVIRRYWTLRINSGDDDNRKRHLLYIEELEERLAALWPDKPVPGEEDEYETWTEVRERLRAELGMEVT